VDLLIHATMLPEGPDGWSPAGYVLRELGCGPIACHEVRQGCNGLLAALELAAGWLALAAGEPTALLTAALKAGTAVLDRWRSPGFGLALGDAGCAVLVGRGPGIARVESVCSRTVGELEGLHRGTGAPSEDDACGHPRIDIPARARQFTAASGHGPLDMHRMLAGIHASVASRALAEAEVEPTDLACVIYTNAGRVITDAHLLQPLGLPATLAAACDLGRTIGHLGACDQFVSLDHLCQTGRLVSGDRVLLAGGTQGYNAASAVLTITG
jgi:3-oxoacyl-[acyl-carrier-protein] synthase III